MVGTRGEEMIWAGLNFVTMNPETDFLVFEDPLLTLNINNEADLEFAQRLALERRI
jgi:GTP:adenosylcobinamide-phosphate guanylyltransferase